MKQLFLMVGLPRSGKSTRARRLMGEINAGIVSPDAIRLALHGQPFVREAEPHVWAIAQTMVRSLFLAGHDNVILDACNNTRRRRDEWLPHRLDLEYDRVFVPVITALDICLERAADNDGLASAIERMAQQHEPISEEEL